MNLQCNIQQTFFPITMFFSSKTRLLLYIIREIGYNRSRKELGIWEKENRYYLDLSLVEL